MYVVTGVSTVFIWGRKIEEALKKIKKEEEYGLVTKMLKKCIVIGENRK